MIQNNAQGIFDYPDFSEWARFPSAILPMVELDRDLRDVLTTRQFRLTGHCFS